MSEKTLQVHTDMAETLAFQLDAIKHDDILSLPWHNWSATNQLPTNIDTAEHYGSINALILWHRAFVRGYKLPLWGTYRQFIKHGYQIQEGEYSTKIIFRKYDKATAKSVETTWSIFNVEQAENVSEEHEFKAQESLSDGAKMTILDSLIKNSRADIEWKGSNDAYSERQDKIIMPDWTLDQTAEEYQSMVIYYLVRWTGHRDRLNRKLNYLGQYRYAAEELIAEISCAFLCSMLGLKSFPRKGNQRHIDDWVSLLMKNPQNLEGIARKATHAANWLKEKAT